MRGAKEIGLIDEGAESEAGARRSRKLVNEEPQPHVERYTEADIAQLEREDPADLTVIEKLREAYRQNDPNEKALFPGFRCDPSQTMIGTGEHIPISFIMVS